MRWAVEHWQDLQNECQLSISLATRLNQGSDYHALSNPASFATMCVGSILLTTRFKSLKLVVGYLVLENGNFIFGMLLIEAMPFVIEMGDYSICSSESL